MNQSAVFRGLIASAAFVILVAGLKAASDILLPILFAGFLAILAIPLLHVLQKRARLPAVVAIPVVVLVFTAILLGISAVVGQSLRSFTDNIGAYEQPFNKLLQDSFQTAEAYGVQANPNDVMLKLFKPAEMFGLLRNTLEAVVALFARLLIVVVTLTFMLLEASELELKFKAAFGTEARPAGPFTDATSQVQRYLAIKSAASALTGILIAIGCTAIGLDFPILWGLLAFLLNYIPSIGSIVAAIPAILLCTVQLSPLTAVGLMAFYLAVNVSIGNFAEPRLMGRSLGLSPLVVFLSLLFWGWVWGPIGMLFCVPMTVIAKLVLETQDDTRWIAVFLGSPREILIREGKTP